MGANITSLPPGCCFYPSDQQLILHYLTQKTSNIHRPFNPINDLDLYDYSPFDLPNSACFRFGRGGRRQHWYCYVAGGERGARRRAGGGWWRKRGRERDVVGGGAGKVVVGTRKSFVFYLGDSSRTSVRTDWVMYEYALVDRHKEKIMNLGFGRGVDSSKSAPRTNWVMYKYLINLHEVSFVLCRILVKLSCSCKSSDHVLSSCGEESFATVRDIGIQHDGNITSSFRGNVVQNDDSVDKKDEDLQVKFGLVSKIDQITARDTVVSDVELLPHEPVLATRDGGDSFLIDNLTAQQLVSILEEDYIELDDLTTPLAGID